MSPTITTAAPSRWHDAAQASPTGPAPATYTVDPVVTPAVYSAVIPGRENVGQQRQVLDLGHRLGFVRKLQQVEIGIGNHHVFRLAADPAAHIDVAVSRAGPRRIHVQADPGLAFFAIPAAPAGDVERDRAEVADFDELHVPPRLDHLAGDLVAQDQALRAPWSARAPCADRSRKCWW